MYDAGGKQRAYHSISVVEVVLPVGADGLLSSHIPDVELEALGGNGLDVETLGGSHVGGILICQLLQDGGLA